MRKTRKNKIKRRKTQRGIDLSWGGGDGKNVGDIIVTNGTNYGRNEFGEVKKTRFNKNHKKHLSVKLFNNDELKEFSENDVKPVSDIFRTPTPFNIACYKRKNRESEIYDLIEEKIPGIPNRGAFADMIRYLNAFVIKKIEESGGLVDDFIFRAHPSTFYLIDIESGCIPKLVNDKYENNSVYSLNSVYVFKFSLQYEEATIEFLDYDHRGEDRAAEKKGNQVSIINDSERSGIGDLSRFNVLISDLYTYFYFANPFSLYINQLKSDAPEMDKRLYDNAFPLQVSIILSNLAKQYSVNNNSPLKITNGKMFKRMKEHQKLYKKVNDATLTNYKSKKLSKVITNQSIAQIERALQETPYNTNTFINDVYKARAERRRNTIRRRTPEEINIIATSMALSDNVPFFENK